MRWSTYERLRRQAEEAEPRALVRHVKFGEEGEGLLQLLFLGQVALRRVARLGWRMSLLSLSR